MTKFLQQLIAARNVSTPLIAVKTIDPAATVKSIYNTLIPKNESDKPVPFFQWDVCNGLDGLDELSKTVLRDSYGSELPGVLADVLISFSKFKATGGVPEPMIPAESVIFIHNAQRFIDEVNVIQALWNLRDIFKADFRTVILLVNDITLPAELTQDILVLDEPLPTNEELAEIAKYVFKNAYHDDPKATPDEETIRKIVDATCGLAAYTAETSIAMSLSEDGINFDDLWERKRVMIENMKGLSVYRGKEKLDDVKGIPNLTTFLRRLVGGNKKYRGIVFLDEADKHVANFNAVGTGDTTQEMLGPVLSFMEDHEVDGLLLVGVPGCGKSLSAKAFGNEIGAPTIIYDFSGMKAQHVGESGANVRAANKVAYAMSQGALLFVATCNNVSNLPAEFRSRFALGTFFFDLPNDEARDESWKLYTKKFNVKDDRPNDKGWTPREIRNCCRTAASLNLTLKEAADYIVPVSKSNAARIDELRKEANGAYLDTVNKGFYKYEEPRTNIATSGPRSIKVSK